MKHRLHENPNNNNNNSLPLEITRTSLLQNPKFLLHLFNNIMLYDSFDDDAWLHPFSSSSSHRNDFAEQFYLVDYRWFNAARVSVFSDVVGVLYDTRSEVSRPGNGWDESDEEIVMSMSVAEADGSGEGEGRGSASSRCEYALVLEWMFFRALKWHNDAAEEVGNILALEDTVLDLYSLKISLSFLRKTNVVEARVCQKDNKGGAYEKACNILCLKAGLFHIWDFSGKITQFCIDSKKLSDDAVLQNEETFLELQVYKLPHLMNGRDCQNNEVVVDQFESEDFNLSGSLEMNGSKDDVRPTFRVACKPVACGHKEACVMGLTGLLNIGNTCFMNSAVQCLIHTPKIVDYFLGDFRKDLNFQNSLNGKLALAFGNLLRKLWAPGARTVDPCAFKTAVSDFFTQFKGSDQQDSQEFLNFLLEGLHGDLNRVKVEPKVEVKDADDLPVEEAADEYWSCYLASNNSIIVDLCKGQVRSTLVCPVCKKLSAMFEPYTFISLPLPSTSTRTMTLTVLSTDGSMLPVSVTVTVPKLGRFEELVQAVSTSCSLQKDEMLMMAEIYGHRILRILDNLSESIELLRDYDRLVAYRLPKDCSGSSSLVVFMHQHKDMMMYISPAFSWKKFGTPVLASMSDVSKGNIRKVFLKLLNPFILPAEDSKMENDGNGNAIVDSAIILDGDVAPELEDVNANTELEDGDLNKVFGGDPDPETDFQFFFLGESEHASSSSRVQMNEPLPISGSCRKYYVLVSWPDKMIELYDTASLSSLPQICEPTFLTKSPQESVSLYNCIEAFLKEEPLDPENMWKCPKCKEHRQASKKLDLLRLPEILFIHLKRFASNHMLQCKLETFVDFPIEDLDLSTYSTHKSIKVSHRYALYAVSNHYGGLTGGHYTAFIQHGQNQWYEFDDSRVFPVSKEQIKTSAAYVLCYRRV